MISYPKKRPLVHKQAKENYNNHTTQLAYYTKLEEIKVFDFHFKILPKKISLENAGSFALIAVNICETCHVYY